MKITVEMDEQEAYEFLCFRNSRANNPRAFGENTTPQDLRDAGLITERTKNCLMAIGIDHIGDLARVTESELKSEKNVIIGNKTFSEIARSASVCGVVLRCA